MPEPANKVANQELDRLGRMTPASPEYQMIRTYIDWLLDVPWATTTEDRLDPVRDRLRDRTVEERLLGDRRRVRRIPHDRDPVLGHPDIAQRREERRAAVVRVLPGVVGHAVRRAGGRTREHEGRQEARQGRSCLPHTAYLGSSAAAP